MNECWRSRKEEAKRFFCCAFCFALVWVFCLFAFACVCLLAYFDLFPYVEAVAEMRGGYGGQEVNGEPGVPYDQFENPCAENLLFSPLQTAASSERCTEVLHIWICTKML